MRSHFHRCHRPYRGAGHRSFHTTPSATYKGDMRAIESPLCQRRWKHLWNFGKEAESSVARKYPSTSQTLVRISVRGYQQVPTRGMLAIKGIVQPI